MSSSGSRLPGDSESTDRHKSKERAEARLSGDLASRFVDYVDAHGESQADVVREALDEYLPASERSQYVLPSDPDLADAYLALAGDEVRTFSAEQAKNIVCRESHPNTKKEVVKDEVLEPLKNIGLISVKCGKVGVRPLTERGEILEDSDGE